MLKPFFQSLSIASALLFASHSVAETFSVSPASLNIQPGQDYDAIVGKHIYRSLEIAKAKDQNISVSFERNTESYPVEVTAIVNTCSNNEEKCQIILDIVSSDESFQGVLKFNDQNTQTELSSECVLRGKLEKIFLSALESEGDSDAYYNASVLECKDLFYAFNPLLASKCQTYSDFLDGTFSTEKYLTFSKNSCNHHEVNDIERSKCEGLNKGLQLSNCENLDPIGTQSCSLFHKAAVKNCSYNDFDCIAMQRMLHGYLNCSDRRHGDLLAVCTAYQNAYLKGISSQWIKNHFLPFAKSNSKHLTERLTKNNNSPYLAYIAPSRFEKLGIEKEDREFLINEFPTLSRSVFLNTPNSKTSSASNNDVFSQIESHLDLKQTVGFELECPAVKLDITSGFNKPAIADSFWSGYAQLRSDMISPEERERKELAIDSEFKKHNFDSLFFLKHYGVWHDEKEWPYFNTYGMSLFETVDKEMNLPLVSTTLESRYGSAHFPHIELVTAPLSLQTKPLNLRNTRSYLMNLVKQTCSNPTGYSESVKLTDIEEWKGLADQLPVANGEGSLEYDFTAKRFLHKSSMICMSRKLNNCHVQSNVGVYLDQMFTDAFLVQSLGHNGPYRSDKVYDAAWNITKRLFTFMQWAHSHDPVIDRRNHAAGLFTYMINDLYLRSILYAGGFEYWKGTLSHIMKYEIRRVFKALNFLERDLFETATLNLWHSEGLPKEFTDLTEDVLSDFLNKTDWNDLKIPSGNTPRYDAEFAGKVEGIFKEMLWTIVMSDEEDYTKSLSTLWGSVVSDSTDLTYYDPETNTKRDRAGFVHGDSEYASHCGGQCDVGKRIRPVFTTVAVDDEEYERIYTVVETRYGNADFNQAVFWRCHENNKDRDHHCPN